MVDLYCFNGYLPSYSRTGLLQLQSKMLPGCDSFCLGPFGDGAGAKLCCRNYYAGVVGVRGRRANRIGHEFLDQLNHYHAGGGLFHGCEP